MFSMAKTDCMVYFPHSLCGIVLQYSQRGIWPGETGTDSSRRGEIIFYLSKLLITCNLCLKQRAKNLVIERWRLIFKQIWLSLFSDDFKKNIENDFTGENIQYSIK